MPATLTDRRELCAYAIAHLAGIACGLVVSPWFSGLIATGGRLHRELPGLTFSAALGIGVMLAFLVLRRRLADPEQDAGFALGLALLTFIMVGLWYGLHNYVRIVYPPIRVDLSAATIAASAAVGTFAGALAALRWTRHRANGPGRAVSLSLLVATVAFPVAAILAGSILGGPGPTNGPVEIVVAIVLALIAGGITFLAPSLLLTFLWSLLHVRLKKRPAPGASAARGGRRDLSAYILAHVAAIGWGVAANPWLFWTLQTGHRDPRWLGLALLVVLALVVLAAFLFLRRGLDRGSGEDRLGFALGLALLTFIVLAGWDLWQSRLMVNPVPVSPGGVGILISGAIGTFVGSYAACGWTRDRPDGPIRALQITATVALLAFPVAALLISAAAALSTAAPIGNALAGFLMVVMVGGAVFVLPCLAVTFLWCLAYFRLVRTAQPAV